MAKVTRALGRFGEDVAAQHLEAAGMQLVERNWRCGAGEIDIVAMDRDALVVCEVKTRRGSGFGAPVEAVTPAKLARLRRLAVRWLTAEHPELSLADLHAPDGSVPRIATVRIDVIGVLVPLGGPVRIDHLVGVS